MSKYSSFICIFNVFIFLFLHFQAESYYLVHNYFLIQFVTFLSIKINSLGTMRWFPTSMMSLIPGIHIKKEQKQLPRKLPSDVHMCSMTGTHPHIIYTQQY